VKLHLRADEADGTHTKFTVFMNGGNCGQLCMTEAEAIYFEARITLSKYETTGDEVRSTGKWFKEIPEVKP